MFEKFWGWIGLAVMLLVALPYPLILLGFPLEYAWPIALTVSAVLLISRPGGTVEKFITTLFAYGMVFTLWCVGGAIAVLILGLVVEGIRPPLSLFLIAAVGFLGVIREAVKNASSNSSKQS